MNEKSILIVEDESHLAAGLKLNLELEGFRAIVASSAKDAGRIILSEPTLSLILLDVMLPDASGFDFCRQLRDAGNFVPVIMLTAKSSPSDRVEGLEAGADDYVPKPFSLDELLARVRSTLRRRGWERENRDEEHLIRFGDACIDFRSHEVSVAGKARHLTQLEFELLRYFVTNPNRVLSRHELLGKVWKVKNTTHTRTVDNFVSRLRKHFENDPARPRFFVSLRSAGYRFVPEGAVTE